MKLSYRVTAPEGSVLEEDFDTNLSEILVRAEVPFEIEQGGTSRQRTLVLTGVEPEESRYVLRLLQRAGYNLEIREESQTPSVEI